MLYHVNASAVPGGDGSSLKPFRTIQQAAELALPRALQQELPRGVIPTERGGAVFLQNYSGAPQRVVLEACYTDLLTGQTVEGETIMPANGVMVLVKA